MITRRNMLHLSGGLLGSLTLPACSAKSLPLKDSGFPGIDQQTPGSPFGLGFFHFGFL